MRPFAAWMLTQEARALLTRLERVRPFALLEPMVPAANLLPRAQSAIERHLVIGRRDLRHAVQALHRLAARARQPRQRGAGATPLHVPAPEVQRRADAVRSVQRRHHPAQRARDRRLAVGPGRRGGRCAGAAGRLLPRRRRSSATSIAAPAPRSGARARDCPAAATNPVAIIRVPRERMVGSGIASSLVPRGGPPGGGAARSRGRRCARCCSGMQRGRRADALGWQLWERWISEIVADFWSVARARHRLDARADGRRQPAARVRLPRQSRRPASRALDPREAQLRDGPGALSASAVEPAWPRSGSRSTRSTGSIRSARELLGRCGHDAGVRGAAAASPAARRCAGARWPRRSTSPSASPRGSLRCSRRGRALRRQHVRAPAVAGVRGDRPGARRRPR